MNNRTVCALCIAALGLPLAAQSVGRGQLEASIDIEVNALEITMKEYSDRDIRQANKNDKYGFSTINLGPTGWDWVTDSKLSLGYTAERYGGKLSIGVNKDGTSEGMGAFMVWVQFLPFLKLTTGTDIESTYADSLDADPKLRIYRGATANEWDSSINPDNITGSSGLLLESAIGPVTLAAAAQYNTITSTIFQIKENTNNTEGEVSENLEYHYGARVGSTIGEWGKVNASYTIHYKRIADSFNYMRGEFGPLNADAEVYTHSFGLYASLTPFKDLGVTLGYAGIYTKYLDEFLGSTRVIETLVPYVLKSGLSLNARYQGIPNLTLRTDHNYSFWADMDYRIFEIPQVGNMGLISSASAAAYADVTHLVLWNGLGATYNFNEHCSLEIYLRNLYRDDRAEDFVLTRNQFVVEPKLTWKIDDRFSMWAGVSWELLVDTVSEELNKRGAKSNVFVSGNAPIETRDTTQVIKVPLGVNLKL